VLGMCDPRLDLTGVIDRAGPGEKVL